MRPVAPDSLFATVTFRRGCCKYLIVELCGRLYLQRPNHRPKSCDCELRSLTFVAASDGLGLWDRDVEDPREDAWT